MVVESFGWMFASLLLSDSPEYLMFSSLSLTGVSDSGLVVIGGNAVLGFNELTFISVLSVEVGLSFFLSLF